MKQLLVIAGVLLLVFSCRPEKKEMTYTTSSDEALELFLKGRDLVGKGELLKGRQIIHKALELDPGFAVARLWLGTNEETEKALELIDMVTPGEAYLIQSSYALSQQDYSLSEQYIDSLLELFPEDKHVMFAAAAVYNGRDPEKAIEYHDKAIALDENFSAPYNIKAYQLMALNRFDEAENSLLKYIELEPESGNPYDSYGDLLSLMGNYDKANEQYNKAFMNDSFFSVSLSKIGANCLKEDDFEGAKNSYQRYYKSALNETERNNALRLISYTSFIEGNYEQGHSEMENLRAQLMQNNETLQYILTYQDEGKMMLESYNPKEALPYFEKLLELAESMDLEDNIKSKAELIGQGYISLTYAFTGAMDKAEEEYEIAKNIFDNMKPDSQDDSFINYCVAGLEITRGNYENAIRLLEPGTTRNSLYSLYYTALAYDKAGNTDKANEFYNRVLYWGPLYNSFFLKKAKQRVDEIGG